MTDRYIAFDVETPNFRNDRMSALGITVIEGGRIIEELDYLVNPETYFNRFNIELTGITPEMVRRERTFGELWPEVEPVFSSGILVAHNAVFDMGVLSKCLRAYGIYWCAKAAYTCTCRIGRRALPELPDHRLSTMCRFLGIGLNHHNAGSDSRACAELLLHYMSRNVNIEEFVKTYYLG
ncbi:MAG: 3'-5' exonuclease [Oscillospiraceae bacterium]|nr:3'-5' exonuclease [Oscillospiraceae bacterium]